MSEAKPLTVEAIAPCLKKVSRTADGRGFALVELDCSSQEVDSIEELAKYEHLRTLNLQGNAIVDVKPVASLQFIMSLDISSNQVANLECFDEAVLPHCRFLDASKNALTSIGKLNLAQLRSANFRGNQIGPSLEGFGGHDLLETLDLGENKLAGCAGVANMPALTKLQLDANELTSVEGLGGLDALAELELQKNQLEALDLGALKGCLSVHTADLSENQLAIKAFWELQALASLRHLKAEGNPVEGNAKIEILGTLERLATLNGEEVTEEDREEARAAAAAKKEAEAEAAAAGAAEGEGDEA